MKIDYDHDFKQVRERLAAMPSALQADVYGKALTFAARKARTRARQLCPTGKGPALTLRGTPRRRLRDSILVKTVAWKWDGVRVPRSAALLIAEQPHAHLVEKGTVRTKASPFLEPSVKTGLLPAFQHGARSNFTRLIQRLEAGRLTARERRAFYS